MTLQHASDSASQIINGGHEEVGISTAWMGGKDLTVNVRFPLMITSTTVTLWTSPGIVDTPQPHFEARSKASGLIPPRWLCRRVRL